MSQLIRTTVLECETLRLESHGTKDNELMSWHVIHIANEVETTISDAEDEETGLVQYKQFGGA